MDGYVMTTDVGIKKIQAFQISVSQNIVKQIMSHFHDIPLWSALTADKCMYNPYISVSAFVHGIKM